MIFFAVPNISSNEPNYDAQKIRVLRDILIEQQEMITELSTIVGYLEGFQGTKLDEQEISKYNTKTLKIRDNQNTHFAQIDEMINENIMAIKKEKTTDQTIMTFGKEVRKLEAGIRTLRLFTVDVIEMLDAKSTVMDRVKDRVQYFEKRSATLEVEAAMLLRRMAFL